MWIEELDIRGFKRLEGEYRLSPRLTVFHGANEAGKSTMHDALTRTLCGFTGSERRRIGGESELERCTPWNGNPFAIHAVVHAKDSRLRIEWDFKEHTVKLVDLESGEDLSDQVLAKRHEVTLSRYLLGLGPGDFAQACCLGQADIAPVTHSEELVVALQRAVESGATDTGVDDAVERINEFLRSRVGVRVDNLRPNAGGRLGELLAKRDQISSRLEQAEAERERIAALEVHRQERDKERSQLEEKVISAERVALVNRAEALADRLRRADEHKARASFEAPSEALPDEPKEREIAGLFAEADRLQGETAELRPRAEASKENVAALEKRRAELQASADRLAAYEGVNPVQEDRVRDLLARRAELEEPSLHSEDQAEPPTPVSRRSLIVVAAVIAIGSVAAGLLVSPAGFAGLLVAGALALAAGIAIRATQPLPSPQALQTRRHELGAELTDALDHASVASLGDVEQRARGYLVACDNHENLLEVRAELGGVAVDLQAASAPLADLDRNTKRIDEIDRMLRGELSDLGIEAPNLDDIRIEWEARVRVAKSAREKQVAAQEAEEGHRTALGDLSYEELGAQSREASDRLRAHVQAHGELQLGPPGPGDPQKRLEELTGQLHNKEVEIAGLAAQIQDREKALPDVPALREGSETISATIQRLETAASAAQLARDRLEIAGREARRAFRPQLQEALNKNLARITNGRYESVEIDDELNISVIVPETGQLMPAERLSRGTQDQIFFVERLEMIDLLDPTTDKAPLLLDEPFVNFDDKRLPIGLQLLVEESSERQVILFTTDPDVADEAEKLGEQVSVLELQAPGSR